MLCRLYNPHLGGVERHVEGLSKELMKRGHEISIMTEQFSRVLALEEKLDGVHIYRIPNTQLKGKGGIWSWVWANRKLFEHADLIHAHDVSWWYFPLRFWLWTKPIFTTFHGYEPTGKPKVGAIISRLLAELLSNGVICVGDWMKKWYFQTPELVIYGAAETSTQVLPRTKSAIFIGRLESDTGILEFIKAIKILKGKISLDIFGDGPLKKSVIESIKGYTYIKYREKTDQPANEISKHRFIFASQYLSMLEAQQVGRQVFSYMGEGLKPDYLGSFPTSEQIVTFQNPKELAKKIILAMSNPKIEEESIRKANKWAKKQTWKKLANEYEELWQK